MVISIMEGVENSNGAMIKMAKSFQLSRRAILKKIIFFDSLPSIFSGIKIAIGRGVVGIVIAELFGQGKGLGYLIAIYGSTYQTEKLIFIIFLLFLITLLSIKIVSIIEKKVLVWKSN